MSHRAVCLAILNDYAIVVAGTAAVLAPFAGRVEVVELDARTLVTGGADVVLYDPFGKMAQGNAIDIKDLTRGKSFKVVVFSWDTDEDLVARAIKAGASGYVHKGVSGEELVLAVEAVHRGEQVLPAGRNGDAFGRWPGDQHGLSARESEVLALICQGLSNQQIAERVFLGINTVKTYIRTAYRKVGATSRTQAVLWGLANGFELDDGCVVNDDP